MEGAETRLSLHAAGSSATGVKELIFRYKCLNLEGEYLRSSLRIYVFLYILRAFSLLVSLTAHRRSLFEYPSFLRLLSYGCFERT
jgi:hypothetical protein